MGFFTRDPKLMLFLLIVLALAYAFFNGYRDSSSILAGVIASRAIHPRWGLYLASVAELTAPFLFGVTVARTVATGLVDPSLITLQTLVIALAAALGWTLFAWRRGIPSSSSHALVGGLIGAALLLHGPQSIFAQGLIKVVLPLFLAPPLGMLVGYLTMHLLLFAFRRSTPRVNRLFRRLQIGAMLGLALSHSANDAQKSMGVIALGMVAAGRLDQFSVPLGVTLACAVAIALGASFGDWRLIRTLGGKIYRIRPLNSLASQLTSIQVILAASLTGAPVSTSQVVSMALMGSGAAERINKVRWQVLAEMLITWAITIPATAGLSLVMAFAALEFHRVKWLANWIIHWLSQG